MSNAAAERRFTPEEYLILDRRSENRSEYYQGLIYAMAGASRAHNLITVNLARELSARVLDRACEVYSGEMRVCVLQTGLYTYPDVVAVCGEPRFLDDQLDTLTNPTLIIEVLSPSTENTTGDGSSTTTGLSNR